MNEILGAALVATSLAQVNESIKQLGFNNINDLTNAIRQLDIEIAKSKDDGKPYAEKEKLRNQYIQLQNNYEKSVKEAEEKRKSRVAAVLGITLGLLIVSVIIILWVCLTL